MPHERIVRGRLAYDHRASAIQCSSLMEQMKGTLTAGFFARRYDQYQTGRAFQDVREIYRRDHESSHARFHIARTAPIQLACFRISGEWIHFPFGSAERNRIDMSREAKWRLVCSAANGRHKAGSSRG